MVEDEFAVATTSVRVDRLAPRRMRILRTRGADEGVLRTLSVALGAALPTEPNRASGQGPLLLWSCPGEWVIVGDEVADAAIVDAAAGARVAHLADVSDGRVCYAVSGHKARDLIAKGCPIDLHPRVFGLDRCAQSVLAQVFVLIHQVSAKPVFQIHADASYAHHLELWFRDAAVEFSRQDPSWP